MTPAFAVTSGSPLALELVQQLGQLLAARHLPGELLERHLGPPLVQDTATELQDDEVVARSPRRNA
jgi:hypothetical protein